MSKKKNGRGTAVMKKRVPWHVTLFTGGAWFLLMAGLRPEVILVSSIMILGGILYLCWPKIRSNRDQDGGPEPVGSEKLEDGADLVGDGHDPADGVERHVEQRPGEHVRSNGVPGRGA